MYFRDFFAQNDFAVLKDLKTSLSDFQEGDFGKKKWSGNR
jgi:hypothetical protein